MSYDFRNENNYGGYDPNASSGSATQRNGYTGNYGSSGPYGGQAYYEINKRTESVVMFSDTGVMLKCAFVNDMLSITICNPSIDPATGKSKYQKENQSYTLLKPERVTAFCKVLDDHLKIIDGGEFHSCGVWTNKDHSTMLGLTRDQDGDALILYTGITQASGGIPTKILRFDFREEAYVMENYDPSTGMGTPITIKAQFYLFLKLLNLSAEVSLCGGAHQIRHALRYELNKLENDLQSIMERVGAVPRDTRSNQGYNRQATTGYHENNNYSKAENGSIAQGVQTPVEVVTLDDIPF